MEIIETPAFDESIIAAGKKLWDSIPLAGDGVARLIKLTSDEYGQLWAYNDFLHRESSPDFNKAIKEPGEHYGITPEKFFGATFRIVSTPTPCQKCGKPSVYPGLVSIVDGVESRECDDEFHHGASQ